MISAELSNQAARSDVGTKKMKKKVKVKKTAKGIPDTVEAEEITTGAVVEAAEKEVTFASLGVCEELCQACKLLKWTAPTRIQQESIPWALQGRDIIGLAETGSGKTGAFALPIIQRLLDTPQRFFAVALAPTRELCVQIGEQFEAIGSSIKLQTATIVGGLDMVTQACKGEPEKGKGESWREALEEEPEKKDEKAILVDEEERPWRKGNGEKGKGKPEKGKGEPEKGKEALEEEQEKKDEKDERDWDEKAVEEESEKGKSVALMDGRGGHAQKRNRKSSGQDCEHPHQAPATAVQDLAEAAVHSGVKQKDLEALSRLGAHGKSPQNCPRDLISSCFVDLFSPAVSVFKAPYKFLDKDTGDQTTKWHDTHVLYPHDWFVALDKASLTDRLRGTTDDIDSFWKWQKIDNPKFFRNAFYEGLENFEKLVPILVHCDGAQHAEHDSLVAVSFRSLLTTCSVEDSQFLCAGSCKSCKDEGTWPVHWKHLAWSFTALARGIHPCEDADGNSWPIGSYRASVAGTPLCPNSGFRAVIWVLAGDMDYLQVDLGLPHQASLDPCAWCKCNKSDTPFNDFRENAKWKTVRISPADHIADPVTNHLIMTIPGVNFFCFHLDSLHVLDLGVTSHAIGNLLWEFCVDHLPGNRAVALATLNKKIAEIYIELNVPKSKWVPALTYKHFNATASTYPNLKHMKGGQKHTDSCSSLSFAKASPARWVSLLLAMSYGKLSFINLAFMTVKGGQEDKLWIDSTEHEGSLSYKEPVENVTMEPEEEVTMPVKNKLTIAKQFHSLQMK
ncbi:unnamed protein product [Polarella glacialis]|uniref:RNA helicase n=1 Tax=Polarella glacialis TaxID=89957 RepID=A0A813KSQ2_POLGL|nr:unnamed protein product [Polarella glacialis]